MKRRLSLPGDEEVFSRRLLEVEQRLRARTRHFARGDYDDAEDLFQEICVRLWEKSGSYRGDGSFAAWALRVGDRVCLDSRRHTLLLRARVPISEELRLTPYTESEAERAARTTEGYRTDSMMDAVRALSPRLRAIIHMRYWLGWKAPRIAQSLHVAVPSVWTALSQARRILRQGVQPPGRPDR